MTDVLTLAKALLSCPSLTPDEAGTLDLIHQELAPLGFQFDIEKTPNGTTNAWITHGQGAPLFVFAGHLDVVPPGDLSRWTTPPFTPTERDGYLFARGASDMKAGVAASVVAAAQYVATHPNHQGTIALLLTSDEEGDGLEGTCRVVEKLRQEGVHIDYCILGEPTSANVFGDTIKNGRRGSLNGKITIHGKLGHVAYPHLAINPIHKAAPLLAALSATKWDDGTPYFGPSTFQFSNIHAGVGADNVVPGELTMNFNIRFNTEWTPESILARINQIIADCGLSACEYTLEHKVSALPFVTEIGPLCEALEQAIQAETGIKAQCNTTGGTSDARFISTISTETVEFGPRNDTIHSVNERVGLNELTSLVKIYEKTLTTLLETKS